MARHRFVHIGDLHLGPNARNADRQAALEQIVREQLAHPVAAWLLPGDLNHGLMTIADRNFLVLLVQQMAEHAPVIVCYGNHDLPGELDFLAKVSAQWRIHVIDRPEVFRIVVATGGWAVIFALPYPSRAGLVAAGTPSELVPERAREALEAIFISAADDLQAGIEAGCIPLMIGHVNVGGSIASSGQPSIGREIELDPVLLNRLGPIYKGLNHIHRAQDIGGAVYAGSCCRLDWGEIEEKRYLTVDYTRQPVPEEPSECWTYTVASHPIDVAPMFHVEGELTREGFTYGIANGGKWPGDPAVGADLLPASPPDWTGAEVRVRFRYAAADKAALNFDLVKVPFVGAKRIDLDPIAENTRALRAPEVAAAVTLEEKVAAFIRSSGLNWSPSLQTKFAALQAPDGAAFLTELENSVIGPVIDAEVREEVCQ
jgi:hypothetical protein